jgi:hypothetical protein
MTIDVEKLHADAGKAQARRLERKTAKGQADRVLMANIRQALPAIESLRAPGEKPTWDDIAAALSDQGLKTRNGQPLTGKRLTSLIHEIRKLDEARALREAKRRARVDVAPREAPLAEIERRPRLSPELPRSKREGAGADPAVLEAEIRDAQYERHSNLFKGKT